jgi:hypothetical protein
VLAIDWLNYSAEKMRTLAFLMLCFASVALAGTNFIDGQVFIVTGGHESVKLGLVAVAACRPDEFASAVASTKSQIESERPKLDDIRLRANKSVELTSHLVDVVNEEVISSFSATLYNVSVDCIKLKVNAEHLADRVSRRSEYLNSAAPYFKNLPHPIALVKTDADGKFKMELPSPIDQVIIVASTTRQVLLGQLENYFWAVKVKPPATTTLSNDNLTHAASSDSALQTLMLTGVPNEEDTADSLKSEGRKLATDTEKILGEIGVPTPPPPQQPQMISLTQPVPVQTESGTVTLPVGTKLQFFSQINTKVHVYYLNRDYTIPIDATDLSRKRSKTAK